MRCNANVLRVGLAGCGTVGSGVVRMLGENADWLRTRSDREIALTHILERDLRRLEGLPLPEGVKITDDPAQIADNPDIDAVIELMGGIDFPGAFISRALENGKHVVTANKALLAEAGLPLLEKAAARGVSLLYEASVAGGIPIVQAMKESLAANRIVSLAGILNGTSNYILSKMEAEGLDFAAALAQAQDLGFAEADPALDIDGQDAAHKLVILIRLAYGAEYPYAALPIRGIRGIDQMDIGFARAFGYHIKLLGTVRAEDGCLQAGVFPTLIRKSALLAQVSGAFNAIRVNGNAVESLFFHGKGAGAMPTASAVASDLLSLARGAVPNNTGFVHQRPPAANIMPPAGAVSRYYVRVMVRDAPGVLRDLAGAMAAEGISIAQAIQKAEERRAVPLVFMTHSARAKAMETALKQMESGGLLLEPAMCYHVLD
ncbi:MAG: homoserine dehydrogenase [Deltaproteobacteria bacterium]|jgi:homoserine dehydrogenase|nr:homoserine dehydrogenase [Deltaproteobacteria bacterium]